MARSHHSDSDSDSLDWNALRERLHNATQGLSVGTACVDDAAILHQRAQALARPANELSHLVETIEVAWFALCDEQYALEGQFVREIIFRPDVTPVPNTPQFLRGIHNLRGEVLAVMDLRSLLNITTNAAIDEWLIVVGKERTEFGFLASAVRDVSRIPADCVRPLSGVEARSRSLLRGITPDAVSMLDGDALLNDSRLYVDGSSPARSG